jgi:hypothetical protein
VGGASVGDAASMPCSCQRTEPAGDRAGTRMGQPGPRWGGDRSEGQMGTEMELGDGGGAVQQWSRQDSEPSSHRA